MHPNSSLKEQIDILLKEKKEGRGKTRFNAPIWLDRYIERKIEEGRIKANRLPNGNIDVEKMNELFRVIVKSL